LILFNRVSKKPLEQRNDKYQMTKNNFEICPPAGGLKLFCPDFAQSKIEDPRFFHKNRENLKLGF